MRNLVNLLYKVICLWSEVDPFSSISFLLLPMEKEVDPRSYCSDNFSSHKDYLNDSIDLFSSEPTTPYLTPFPGSISVFFSVQ